MYVFSPKETEVLLAVLTPKTDLNSGNNPQANIALHASLQEIIETDDNNLPSEQSIRDTIHRNIVDGADVNMRLAPDNNNDLQPDEKQLANMQPSLLMMTLLVHSTEKSTPKRKALMTFFNALIAEGADIDAVSRGKKYSILHLAVMQNDMDDIKVLLNKNVQLEVIDSESYKAIDYATDKAIKKLLSDKGAVHSPKYHSQPPNGSAKNPAVQSF